MSFDEENENTSEELPAAPRYAQTREELIELNSTCCLCGAVLEFKHQVDFLLLKVHEDAFCPTCGVKHKNEDHALH